MLAAGQHQREHIPTAGTRERQKQDPNTSSFEHDAILVGNRAFVYPGTVVRSAGILESDSVGGAIMA